MNNKSENYISIGEMAKMNQTTVTTLRLYDSMGLLKPCYIDKNSHYRYYDIKQNARFDMIQYMKELGMGNDKYKLIDIDNGDKEITLEEAVKDVVPFKAE